MEKGYIGVATKSALSVAHCASKKKKEKKKSQEKSDFDHHFAFLTLFLKR